METVHFTQLTFRTLMDCFARPGSKGTLQTLHSIDGLYPQTLSVLMTLFDGEISFQAVDDSKRLHQELRQWTGAKVKDYHEADFIIVPANANKEQILKVLEVVKIGNLIDPQQSATIVMELPQQSNEVVYQLTGPGILHKELVELGLSPDILALRAIRNREFPLGVDLILIDENGKVLALPRTTKLEEVKS
ncbi:phosphonate C-P lyase system protein PhnH [Lysinibacillus mangiferihumi]|uniref:Phosphonate C-P lyase system protein PhnH n=1 Tax=Lysinibacillus mangiferihumi TaxID=1130819 RepID=A0A4U2Z8Q0_9BACI|nr:phosphonate C-P lyase system protein PhnH [Lysinibacillus mangiferihumi]TKI70639.1 phosphonate C-P lyase system protein PhnH [Lysinibacillus mangiferihumi]